MTETLSKPDILLACDEVRRAAARLEGWKARTQWWNVLSDWSDIRPNAERPLLFVSTVMGVDKAFAERVHSFPERRKAYLLICEHLCKAFPERQALLAVRNPEYIHHAETPNGNGIQVVLKRFFSTMSHEDQAERVFDAWWEKETLVVLSPRFRRLHVPIEKLRPLNGKPRTDVERFEIDDDGAYLYWPSLDVHLGWEQFAQATDEREYLKARQQSEKFNRRYGDAIRRLREGKGLRQSDIGGLTPRQVGRIERGECRATHSALSKFADAHKMNLSDYMATLSDLMG